MPETIETGYDAGEFRAQADRLEEVIEAGNEWAPVIAGVIADLDSIFIRGDDCSEDERSRAVIAAYHLQVAIEHGGLQHRALRLACDALLERGIAKEAEDANR